jgi:hypothetical protein
MSLPRSGQAGIFCAGGVPLLAEFLEKESVLLQGKEHGLRNLEMILAVRGGVQVVGDADL